VPLVLLGRTITPFRWRLSRLATLIAGCSIQRARDPAKLSDPGATVLAAAKMRTEVVRITLLQAAEDMGECELLVAGVDIHGLSVDPWRYLRASDTSRTTPT
jgi:hypothetical protein